MKNPILYAAFLLLTCAVILPSKEISAQRASAHSIATSDTLLTDVDTLIIPMSFDGSFKIVEPWLIRKTGAVTGKIYLEGRQAHYGTGVTTTWDRLDSITLTDVATLQNKQMDVPATRKHAAYRITVYKTGTGTSRFKLFYIKYTGAAILRSDPNFGYASLNYQRSNLYPGFTSHYNERATLVIPAGLLTRYILPTSLLKTANQDRG